MFYLAYLISTFDQAFNFSQQMFEYFHSGQCKRWKAYIETDHPKF